MKSRSERVQRYGPVAEPLAADVERWKSVARMALGSWPGLSIVGFVAESGNAVYHGCREGADVALRLTSGAYRSREDNMAELDYVEFLSNRGAPVVRPLRSAAGRLVEQVTESIVASVFTWAKGDYVGPDSKQSTPEFVCAWGEALGTIHALGQSYVPPRGRPQRYHWRQDLFLSQAGRLAAGDREILELLDELDTRVATMELPSGLIHGDFAPVNFRWDVTSGVIEAFDFGNTCRHLLAADVAISAPIAGRWHPRGEVLFIEGYRRQMPWDQSAEEAMVPLKQLRRLYVYLSRLWKFTDPTPAQKSGLSELRAAALR